MSVDLISVPHIHLWTTNESGMEMGDVLYPLDKQIEAGIAFIGIFNPIAASEDAKISIEEVLEALQTEAEGGSGMAGGYDAFGVGILACEGNCTSPAWN